jgi:hypothetical protein
VKTENLRRPPPPAPPRPTRSRASRLDVATGIVIAIGALVRLAATRNDLWLDEIWTLTLLDTVHSPLGILTELHHDNNHVLNSLLLYFLRPLRADWVYRIPAWGAGVATIILAVRMAALDDEPASRSAATPDASRDVRMLATALVFGGSYPLVHYGSEARGYALAIAFALLAILVTFRDGVTARSRRAPIVWLALVLAVLAHALSVHVLVGLVVWATVRVLRRDGLGRGLATLAWWFLVPVAGFAAFYVGFLRGITVGGGPREGLVPPLLRAIAMTTGLPFDAPPVLLVTVAVVTTVVGIGWLAWRGSDQWLFHLVAIVGSPILLAVVAPTNFYAERYFLVSSTLLLMLGARVLAWTTTRGVAGRTVGAMVLTAFLLGNGAAIVRLLQDGRGSYREALEFMVRHTPGSLVTVMSDHDFRNRLVIEYFAPRLATAKTVRYVRATDADVPSPDWYVAHRPLGDAPPSEVLADRQGNRYRLVVQYPTAPLSGFRWFVFQRVGAPTGAEE